MTHEPITIRSLTDAALAAPFMLGYWPDQSVCVLIVDADGHVLLIMRWHLDAPDVPPHLPLSDDAEAVAFHLVVFDDRGAREPAPWDRIAADISARGVPLGRMAFVSGAADDVVVHSPARGGASSAQAVRIGPEEIADLGRRWQLRPWASSREAYVADIAPDADRQAQVRDSLRAQCAVTEATRDRAIAVTVEALMSGPGTPESVAAALTALRDVRVRDTVLWEVMHAPVDRWAVAADSLAWAVAGAPDDHVAAPATLLAILRWQQGDGSRAGAAVERALAADPSYSLADLINRCLLVGLHPSTWAEGLVGLSREACRRAA
jgi:hypothetical protein